MTVVSLALVIAGFVGAAWGGQNWLVVLVFLGLFGPFLLRELGVLRWRDDFQREAVMRSGMHALVAVGLLLTLSAIFEGGGAADLNHQPSGAWARLPAGIVLILMGMAWGLSWLLQFWGVKTGAFRILLWTMATITFAYLLTLAWQTWHAGALDWRQAGAASARLLLGWAPVLTSRRWPRLTGLLLVGVAGWMLREVDLVRDVGGPQAAFVAMFLLVMPFLVPAIALVTSRGDDGREAEAG